MSTFLRGISVSGSCMRCLSTVDDISHLRCLEAPEKREGKVAQAYGREKNEKAATQNAERYQRTHQMPSECVKHILQSLSLLPWNSFLEGCETVPSYISYIHFSPSSLCSICFLDDPN